MKITYRVLLWDDDPRSEEVAAELSGAGFAFTGERPRQCEIADGDPRWPSVASTVLAHYHDSKTEFTPDENRNADFVAIGAEWHNGYPEPSGDGRWKDLTFDMSQYCKTCGAGLQQRAPFRLKKAPKWGRRSVFGLYWTYDALFVRSEVWDAVFKPFGIRYREVVVDRTGSVIDNAVQLDVTEVVDLDMDDPRLLDRVIEGCDTCGEPRYNYVRRGYQPRPIGARAHMFKSRQYFGSGHQSNRMLYISPALYERIASHRGVYLQPCLPPFPNIPLTASVGQNG